MSSCRETTRPRWCSLTRSFCTNFHDKRTSMGCVVPPGVHGFIWLEPMVFNLNKAVKFQPKTMSHAPPRPCFTNSTMLNPNIRFSRRGSHAQEVHASNPTLCKPCTPKTPLRPVTFSGAEFAPFIGLRRFDQFWNACDQAVKMRHFSGRTDKNRVGCDSKRGVGAPPCVHQVIRTHATLAPRRHGRGM